MPLVKSGFWDPRYRDCCTQVLTDGQNTEEASTGVVTLLSRGHQPAFVHRSLRPSYLRPLSLKEILFCFKTPASTDAFHEDPLNETTNAGVSQNPKLASSMCRADGWNPRSLLYNRPCQQSQRGKPMQKQPQVGIKWPTEKKALLPIWPATSEVLGQVRSAGRH